MLLQLVRRMRPRLEQGGRLYTFQMSGTFTGLNATTSEVIVADVTSGQPDADGQGSAAQSVPVPLSGNKATVPTL